MKAAFVTGADRGLGLEIAANLVDHGWRVFAGSYLPDWHELKDLAGRYPDLITVVPLDIASDSSVRGAVDMIGGSVDKLDLIVNNAAVASFNRDATIRGKQDYADFMRVYNVNAVGALRVVDAVMPLMAAGDLKRICFVSSEAGSIERAGRESWFGYCMSKRALNMGIAILFDALRPKGYTFRILHPGWMKTYMSGVKNDEAIYEPVEIATIAVPYFVDALVDEERLVMRDWEGKEWPW